MTTTPGWQLSAQVVSVRALATTLAALALAVCPSPSAAQAHPGIRGGASLAPARRIPDVTVQVYAGAHVETEPLVKRLVFRPNLEAGFGDGLVVIAVNGEFAWRFQPGALGWAPYVGAGPTLNVFSFGGDRLDGRGTETSTGMSFLAGFEHRTGVFVEFKLCSINRRDIMEPLISGLEELKVGVGYTWR